jgi:hypothetical protein
MTLDQNTNGPRPSALAFAKRGFGVLPIYGFRGDGRCACGRADCESPKHPFDALAPNGANSATTVTKAIKGWYEAVPGLNYGVTTKDLVVIDLDQHKHGDRAWLELTRKPRHHDVHTWRVVSGSGGSHIYFKAPHPQLRTAEPIHGVEIKAVQSTGTPSYVVGPGSLHKSGKRYRWALQCHPKEVELAEVPEWIKTLSPTVKERKRTPIAEWRSLAAARHPDGTRTKAICRLAGHLLANPWNDPLEVYCLLVGYDLGMCDPPLGDRRVYQIVNDFCGQALDTKELT